MNSNLTVVGLDRIGASIGLVFARNGKQASLLGYDADPKKLTPAKDLQIFSRLTSKMEDAIQFADMLLIDLPLDEVQETFKQLRNWINKDALILYFSSSPERAAAWARQALPDLVHFVALTPAINPKYLDEVDTTSPHEDLFENSRIFISHAPDLPANVIRIATDVVDLLGAEPCFADLAEVDGLQAITQLLPCISAAALMAEVTSEPGWKDASHLAGAELAQATRLLDSILAENLGEMLLSNRENSLRVIANLQNSLADIAALIKAGDNRSLQDELTRLRLERENWRKMRRNAQTKKKGTVPGRK
jgi:prephenate dehydrogenase